MKKTATTIGVTIMAMMTFFLLASYVNNKSPDSNDIVPVGTVIYSVIPPQDFLIANKGWAKLDGAQLDPEWQLSKIVNQTRIMQRLGGTLPDASGMFLRSMNYGVKGADPDENREVGEKQYDMVKEHKHTINVDRQTEPDTHSHEFLLNDKITEIQYEGKICGNACGQAHGTDLKYYSITSNTANYYTNDQRKSTAVSSHSHKIKYSDTTGFLTTKEYQKENRPVNVAFYVYIKVN